MCIPHEITNNSPRLSRKKRNLIQSQISSSASSSNEHAMRLYTANIATLSGNSLKFVVKTLFLHLSCKYLRVC